MLLPAKVIAEDAQGIPRRLVSSIGRITCPSCSGGVSDACLEPVARCGPIWNSREDAGLCLPGSAPGCVGCIRLTGGEPGRHCITPKPLAAPLPGAGTGPHFKCSSGFARVVTAPGCCTCMRGSSPTARPSDAADADSQTPGSSSESLSDRSECSPLMLPAHCRLAPASWTSRAPHRRH